MADKLRGAESELVNSGSKPNRLGLSRVSNAAKLIAAMALAACGDKPNTPNPTEIAGVQTYALNGNPDAPTFLPESINGKLGNIKDEGAWAGALQEIKDPQGNPLKGRVDLTYGRADVNQPQGSLVKRAGLLVNDGNNGSISLTVSGTTPLTEADPNNADDFAIIQQGLGGKTDGLTSYSSTTATIRNNGQLRWGVNNITDPPVAYLNRSSKPGKVRVVAKVSPMTTEDIWLVRTDTQDWYQTLKLDIATALAVNNGKSNRQKLIDAGLLDPTSGDGTHEYGAPETQDGRLKITASDKGTILRYDDVTLSYDGNTKLWSQNPNNPTTTSWFVSDSAEVTTSGGRKVIMLTINDQDPNVATVVSVIALVPQGNGTFMQVPVSINPDKPTPDDDKDGLTNDKDPIPQLADDGITVNGQNPTGAVKNLVNGVGDSLMPGYDKALVDGGDSLIHFTNAIGAPQIANRVITLRPGEKIMVAHGSANGTNPSPSFTVKAPDGYELKTTPWSTYKLDGSKTGKTTVTYQELINLPNPPIKIDVLQGQYLGVHDYGRVVGAVIGSEGSVTEFEIGNEVPDGGIIDDGGISDGGDEDALMRSDMRDADIADLGIGDASMGVIGDLSVATDLTANFADASASQDLYDNDFNLPDLSMSLDDISSPTDLDEITDDANPVDSMQSPSDMHTGNAHDLGTFVDDIGAGTADLSRAGMEDDHEHGDGCGCNLGGSKKDKSPAGALVLSGIAVAALMRRRQRELADATKRATKK